MQPIELAEQYVLNTDRHIFLTGKAGTGKTTFLKHILSKTTKKTVVVAPTAVAAINAGGMTIHSLFQLPPGIYIPAEHYRLVEDLAVHPRHQMMSNMRMSEVKRNVLKEMELLVIDEVSMLNADLLDAMDYVLRAIRRNQRPFAGVQVLFIGDLYQLPPVQDERAAHHLKQWYESPYFYNALVLQTQPPLYIELDKVYRQKEQIFLDLLNNIRNNCATANDITLLNSRYNKDEPIDWDNNIILTTHNWKADKINISQLEKIDDNVFTYSAELNGDFNTKALPVEVDLKLKVGAQIMFVKNDSSGQLRYYNGRLAKVRRLRSDTISVVFEDNQEEFELEQETWENIRYKHDEHSDAISHDVIGTFTQYPVRLAWAVTIHKSQGLTFDKVVIDAAAAFAAGQVYVALSRCRSMDGLRLLAPIPTEAISTDSEIVTWTEQEADTLPEHIQNLSAYKWQYIRSILLQLFDFTPLMKLIQATKTTFGNKHIEQRELVVSQLGTILNTLISQQEVADKFCNQLHKIFANGDSTENIILLQERVQKALQFFIPIQYEKLIKPLMQLRDTQLDKKEGKKIKKEFQSILFKFNQHTSKLENLSLYDKKLYENNSENKVNIQVTEKPKVKDTKAETLKLYQEGKTVAEIASLRGLVESTIYGHLSHYVSTGLLQVKEFLSQEKLDKVAEAAKHLGTQSLNPIKEYLGDNITYTELKMAVAYLILTEKK